MAGMTLAELNANLIEARGAAVKVGARREFAIDQGLRVRVGPSGRATFAYRYKAPGRATLRTITLSPIGKKITAADLEAASQLHRAAKRERDAAVDPLAKRDHQRREAAEQAERIRTEKARQDYSVKRLVIAYLDYVSGRKRSWKEDKRILARNVVALIGETPVAEVDLNAVRRVLGALDHAPAMKKNCQAAARACWAWHDPTGPNPWRAERVPVPRPRERILTEVELRALLRRLDTETDPGRDAVELLLLTGTRRLEAMEARREEFAGKEWRIPGARAKASRDHVVLLSTQAQALVKRILASHESPWLFPSPMIPDAAISRERAYKWITGTAKRAAATEDQYIKAAKQVTYTLHDLRRTLSSHLGESLIHDAVIDRILGHTKQGVIKHYNVAKLTEPARAAWQAWADYLDELRKQISGGIADNVREAVK